MNTAEALALLRDYPRLTIPPRVMAQVFETDPYYYNVAAKAGSLRWPHEWRGRNLRIYKQPVIDFLNGDRDAP